MVEGRDPRGVALRRGDGLRRGRPAPARRRRPVRLPHARRREELDGDREGDSRGQLRERRARGSGPPRPSLRRDGNGRLRLVRRRRELAAAPAEPARTARSGTSTCGTATSSRRRTAGRSGCSTTFRRSASSTRRPPPGTCSCSLRARPCACTRRGSRARPSRRTSRWGRTRRTAPSSTTSSKAAATGPLVLEILDAKGEVVRRFASDEKPRAADLARIVTTPDWVAAPRAALGRGGNAPLRLGSPRDAPEGARDAGLDARRERPVGSARPLHGAGDRLGEDAHPPARRREGPAASGADHRRRSRPPERARPRDPGRARPGRGRAATGGRPEGADRGAARGLASGRIRARRVFEGRRRGRRTADADARRGVLRRRGDRADGAAPARDVPRGPPVRGRERRRRTDAGREGRPGRAPEDGRGGPGAAGGTSSAPGRPRSTRRSAARASSP